MSQFFIKRARFAWVVAIFISLFGLLSLQSLPVAQFPEVAPPQVVIQAYYSGASAETITEAVTAVIEEELNASKGLLYYESSSSATGTATITVTFKPGTNPDMAQVDVQNRVKNAEARLPDSVKKQGITIEQVTSGSLLLYTLSYKGDVSNPDMVRLSDYAVRQVNNEIRRIEGVGRLQFFGAEAAMRIWLDPNKLLAYGLSIADVEQAISQQNLAIPAGSFGASPGAADQLLTATIQVDGMLKTPHEFGDIILQANSDGSLVRLADVARIDVGLRDYSVTTRENGKPAVGASVQLEPGANALQTAKAIKQRLHELSQFFPQDIEYDVSFDTSTFVKLSIDKVLVTLAEAFVLVFLVVLLFLQNIRYTLIPTIVVPICLLGTLAVIHLLGFSLNMMTLFGMVLAIGILVDDAIVVVENVERIMAHEGLTPRAATSKAMQQVGGAIIGMTLVLSAVFIPLAFISGSVGVIYQQFSVSLAVSILFSGFLALTLTPAICATLLKPIDHQKISQHWWFWRWFNRGFERLTGRFVQLIGRMLGKTGRYLLTYLLSLLVLGYVYVQIPQAFVPQEDYGYYIVDIQLPPGATFGQTEQAALAVNNYVQSRQATASNATILGFSFAGNGENAAISYVTLKEWQQRSAEQNVWQEVADFNQHFYDYGAARIMAIEAPPIDGLGEAGGLTLRLQDRAGLGRQALLAARDQFLAMANQSPLMMFAMMEGLEDAPQLQLDIDRQKAEALGINMAMLAQAVSTAYGSATINEFSNLGRMQRVIVQADVAGRMDSNDLLQLHITNHQGEAVPLSAFASLSWQQGAVQVSRYNGYPAIKILAAVMPMYSSGEGMAELERIAEQLPPGISYEWSGLSYQEKQAGSQTLMLLALSLLVVFLLLVAFYESWSIPLSVMLIVPIGALGSVAVMLLMQMPNDIYAKVGLVTIIGLSTKNAILIVEFAKAELEKGTALLDATLLAVRLRFRPIVMTSLAFILGVIPLALASGAGSEGQRAIGTGVIGGMLAATTIGILFVPLFFVAIQSWLQRRKHN